MPNKLYKESVTLKVAQVLWKWFNILWNCSVLNAIWRKRTTRNNYNEVSIITKFHCGAFTKSCQLCNTMVSTNPQLSIHIIQRCGHFYSVHFYALLLSNGKDQLKIGIEIETYWLCWKSGRKCPLENVYCRNASGSLQEEWEVESQVEAHNYSV